MRETAEVNHLELLIPGLVPPLAREISLTFMIHLHNLDIAEFILLERHTKGNNIEGPTENSETSNP